MIFTILMMNKLQNSFILINITWFYLITEITSSFVSKLPSTFGFALRPTFGATTFDRAIVCSGGGPPFGCPLTTTQSPDNT